MPVCFNEPLSFTQRVAENLEYVELVKMADKESDALKRMEVLRLLLRQGKGFLMAFSTISIKKHFIKKKEQF